MASSLAMQASKLSIAGASKQVVVIVDPYSTGCVLAQEFAKRGFLLVAVWTDHFSEAQKQFPLSVGHLEYFAQIQQVADEAVAATAATVKEACQGLEIAACLTGGDAGVDLADILSEHLGLRTNGTSTLRRRDKKVQQELAQKHGLRSIRQAAGSNFEDVKGFLETQTYPIVLKPVESGGSDGVKLCHTFQEAQAHFHLLMKSTMVDGGAVTSVLCQEFLQGTEFVVDHVSLDGVHKTMMVWKYDKRPVNGAAFVYFATTPVDPQSPEAKILISYTRSVLDALGLSNGPSHAEIMLTADGSPCLVEMNCRANGSSGDCRPLCCALTGGYSQVEATVDAFVAPSDFMKLPDQPASPFKAFGLEVIMVSYSKGVVKSTPGYEIIRKMPSFVCLETSITTGSEIDYSVDLNTAIGNVILMHQDESVVKRDLAFIRYLEEINALFTLETSLQSLKRPETDVVLMLDKPTEVASTDNRPRIMTLEKPELVRVFSERESFKPLVKMMTTVDASKEVVVMVDPYSTACCVAKEVMSRGFKVIAVWTDGFSEVMKTHVPLSCGTMTYFAEVTEVPGLAATANLVRAAAKQFRLVACMPGGEAGVDLADALSEELKLRTNGTDIPNRRDKKLQQELAKENGLRSVRQAGGTVFSEVEDFLKTEQFPVVLKPTESAGSDGVKLCHDFQEAKEHFELLMSSQMINGGGCPAVLCQEFLRGKEYVIDHVSRDGIHKTMMLWVYDKRSANGAAFVYFGCLPVDPASLEAQILVPYVRGVLDSLGFKHGASHGEVVMTSDGPCLVEMNCRANGGDGSWRPLALALTGGYSQVEGTVDAYLDKKQFSVLPNMPPSPFKASGQEVNLVSFSRGIVKSSPGYELIKQMESFVYLETGIKPGTYVDYTVDLVTAVGIVVLMHHDQEVMERDVARIRELEIANELFEYEPAVEQLGHTRRDTATDLRIVADSRPELY